MVNHARQQYVLYPIHCVMLCLACKQAQHDDRTPVRLYGRSIFEWQGRSLLQQAPLNGLYNKTENGTRKVTLCTPGQVL